MFQVKPEAELAEGFRSDTAAMNKTAAALGDLCGRNEKLTNLIKGEAVRYGLVQIQMQRAGGAA